MNPVDLISIAIDGVNQRFYSHQVPSMLQSTISDDNWRKCHTNDQHFQANEIGGIESVLLHLSGGSGGFQMQIAPFKRVENLRQIVSHNDNIINTLNGQMDGEGRGVGRSKALMQK